MRRIETYSGRPFGMTTVCVSKRDYRQMRDVVRAAELWLGTGQTTQLSDAICEFNAPRKTK